MDKEYESETSFENYDSHSEDARMSYYAHGETDTDDDDDSDEEEVTTSRLTTSRQAAMAENGGQAPLFQLSGVVP